MLTIRGMRILNPFTPGNFGPHLQVGLQRYRSIKNPFFYLFRAGSRWLNHRDPPSKFNKSPTAYHYHFKKGEQVFDSRETLQKLHERLLKKQTINTIISDIQTDSSWNNLAGEIAVKAVTDLPTWPRHSHLKVKLPSGHCVEYGRQANTRPLVLQLSQGHYEAVIADRITPVAGDGNCFYHSLLLTLQDTEQQQLLGAAFVRYDRKSMADDRGNPNVMALRQLLAGYLQENTAVISDYLTENGVSHQQVIGESNPTVSRSRKLQIEQEAALARTLD